MVQEPDQGRPRAFHAIREALAALRAGRGGAAGPDERVREESGLAEGRLSAALDAVPVGLVLVDPRGAVTRANAAALLIAGVQPGREVGSRFPGPEWGLTGPDGAALGPANLPIAAVLESGQAQRTELTVRTTEGRTATLALTLVPCRHGSGAVGGVAIAIEDLSRPRALEEELRKSHRLHALGIFAGGIAHDFNNILTGITASVSLARGLPPGDPRLGEHLAAIERASLQAADLTRQLLTASRGGEPERRTLNLGALAAESCAFAAHGSTSRCTLTLPDELWPVSGNEAELRQTLQNLVLNALQAMPEGGIVTVSVANRRIEPESGLPLPAGQYVQVTVSDRGAGIPPEVRDRVFEPFFTTRPGSAGLGLALVRSIVERHGGLASFETQEGQGSAFSVLLPAAAAESAPAPAAGAPPRPAPRTEARPGRLRVLVMDDEEAVRTVCCEALRSLGHSADAVVDGDEAVSRFAEAASAGPAYDLVILDLTIPGGPGGVETLAALRRIDPRIKAVVSSGYSDNPALVHPEKYGFDGVVAKPYTVRQLEEGLARVVG